MPYFQCPECVSNTYLDVSGYCVQAALLKKDIPDQKLSEILEEGRKSIMLDAWEYLSAVGIKFSGDSSAHPKDSELLNADADRTQFVLLATANLPSSVFRP